MADFDCFCQFTGHTVDFTIQWLTLWPHSKWRNKCYYDNYIFWKESITSVTFHDVAIQNKWQKHDNGICKILNVVRYSIRSYVPVGNTYEVLSRVKCE